MQTCPRCKIQIRGNKVCCPLCEGKLIGEPESPAFPVLKRNRVNRLSLMKLTLFIFLAFELLMGSLLFLSNRTFLWVPIAMIVALVGFVDAVLVLYFRNNVLKLLTIQTYVGMIVCFAVDRLTGYYGWSLEWVVPAAFLGLIAATICIGKGTGLLLGDYIIYLAVDVVLSLTQIIGMVTGLNRFIWPAGISVTIIIICAMAGLFFRSRTLKNASSKMFHV